MSEPGVSDLLRVLLGTESRVLPFAVAVATQLSAGDTAETSTASAVAMVAGVLEPMLDGGEPPEVGLLLAQPVLLASFFQNADLLDPEDPVTAEIASLVMAAMERLSPGAP